MQVNGVNFNGCSMGVYTWSNFLYGLWRLESINGSGYATGGQGNGWMPSLAFSPRCPSATIVPALYNNGWNIISGAQITMQSNAIFPNTLTTLWNSTKTSTAQPYTIEYFFKITGITSTRACLFARGQNVYYDGNHSPLIINLTGGSFDTLEVIVSSGNGIPPDFSYISNEATQYTVSISPLTVNDGNWHHIAIVKPGAQQLKVFIDGTEVFNQGIVSDIGYTQLTDLPIYLFSAMPRDVSPSYNVQGIIDTIRVTMAEVYTSNFPNPVITGDLPSP